MAAPKQPQPEVRPEPRPATQRAPIVVTVTYAEEDDPATADRVVALFRRLLAKRAKR